MRRKEAPPYWLAGGTETCEVCMAVHVLQMQYRCVACDHGLCEQCSVFVWETGDVLCSASSAPERDDEEA
jgi:hypothetical protein